MKKRLLIRTSNRWQQMALARQSAIEQSDLTERRPLLKKQGEREGAIVQSHSQPFVTCLMLGLMIPLFFWVAACSSGGALMTMSSFHDIPLGATSTEVVASAGEPYKIHKKKNGTVEYEYIERIKAGGRDLEERHYILVLKEGKVISKHVKESSPSPYLFDSYEMQTTQSDVSTEEET